MTIRPMTRTTAFRGAAVLSIALVAAFLAAPALADHDPKGVTVFRDVHFRGQYETFRDDVPGLGGTFVGNDAASSIQVSPGCQVTLYRDAHFRGRSVTLRHDVEDLGDTRLGNDQATSMRVDCRGGKGWGRDRGRDDDRGRWGRDDDDWRDRDRDHDDHGDHRGRDGWGRGPERGVTVYEHGDFGGRSETFLYDDPDLRDNPIRQDSISSVLVSPGCRAELFQDTGFRGRSTVVFGAVKNLGYTEVGNDRVSSIRVDCERR